MSKRIFISHNTEWEFIDDFADLIRGFGYHPVVVEKEPDLGLDPNEKSKYYLFSSDMVIFVITKDAVDFQGRPHPKSNVALEIGLAEDKFKPEQKIFFVDEGAKPPSMVIKTHIPVQGGNYYKAIAHLIRNLKKVLPQVESREKVDLNAVERFIILELAKDTHGCLARPVVLKRLEERFSMEEGRFNILRHKLRDKEIITEGEIAIGHNYHGDLYLMLTELGWEIASEM